MTVDLPGNGAAGKKGAGRDGLFATTQWSVVVQAGRGAEAALETLCRTYWHPLYVYARRRGCSPADAEDMTQAFLAHLMQKEAFARADPERGRFRSFLLASMNHFMADAWDKARASKRGGGKVMAMDFQGAETWLRSLASPDTTPEEAFEKRWALSLLEAVYRDLERGIPIAARPVVRRPQTDPGRAARSGAVRGTGRRSAPPRAPSGWRFTGCGGTTGILCARPSRPGGKGGGRGGRIAVPAAGAERVTRAPAASSRRSIRSSLPAVQADIATPAPSGRADVHR